MDTVDFIVGLMRQGYNIEPNQLGFIPDTKIASYYVPRGFYVVQRDLRGRELGYILHGKPQAGHVLTIAQAIIDYDFRNRGFGEEALQTIIERARAANVRQIKLAIAEDIEAGNAFFASQGFILTKTEARENKRRRAINTYVMDLWPLLFCYSISNEDTGD